MKEVLKYAIIGYMRVKIKMFGWLLVVSLALGGTFFDSRTVLAASEEDTEETKSAIEKIEEKLKKEQKEYDAIATDFSKVSSSLNATQAAIARVQNLLNQTGQSIESKEKEITNLENQQNLNRRVLSSLLQQLYYTNATPLVEVVLTESDMQTFFQSGEGLFSTQEKVQHLITDINDVKTKISDEKISLEEAKEDHETLLTVQQKQQQGLLVEKAEVGDELEEQEATVAELQEKLADLKSDLGVLTGKSVQAKDIKEAVEYASDKTGVPKGVLYGFLKAETNLGANTGQCTYKQVMDDAMKRYYGKNKKKYKNSIALMEKRYDIFLDIIDELGYSKSKKVSCTPGSYVGQGGAMGVAQFMGDTWRGYESSIRAHTGSKQPDPWSLTDGVMAMALKLKKAGATSDSKAAIKKASINYLGAYNENYYSVIYYWSRNYKKLF